MCYSPMSSFGTFLFVFCICIFLWIRGNKLRKAISIILFTISLMQLLEGFIWLNIKCNHINKILSLFIPIILYFQPLIILGTVYYFKVGLLSNIFYKNLLLIWVFFLPFFIYWIKDIIGKCTTIGKNGHLVWPKPPNSITTTIMGLMYSVFIVIGFITLNTPWYGIFYFIISAISYCISKDKYGSSWSSMWCHFVNILAAGALFI